MNQNITFFPFLFLDSQLLWQFIYIQLFSYNLMSFIIFLYMFLKLGWY